MDIVIEAWNEPVEGNQPSTSIKWILYEPFCSSGKTKVFLNWWFIIRPTFKLWEIVLDKIKTILISVGHVVLSPYAPFPPTANLQWCFVFVISSLQSHNPRFSFFYQLNWWYQKLIGTLKLQETNFTSEIHHSTWSSDIVEDLNWNHIIYCLHRNSIAYYMIKEIGFFLVITIFDIRLQKKCAITANWEAVLVEGKNVEWERKRAGGGKLGLFWSFFLFLLN